MMQTVKTKIQALKVGDVILCSDNNKYTIYERKCIDTVGVYCIKGKCDNGMQIYHSFGLKCNITYNLIK